MRIQQFTYLFLHLITILGPLSRSFEPRIQFYKKWKRLLISITITAIFFIVKDVFFTKWAIWSFNEKYITGFRIFNLPIEEILFFFTVPFACIFIFEAVGLYFTKKIKANIISAIQHLLMLFLFAFCLIGWGKTYTFFYASSTLLFVIFQTYYLKPNYLTQFYITYLFHLIPFLLINGFLTALPVVLYNNAENLNLRCFTIPVEDFVYSFLLLAINISIYKWLELRKLN